MISDKGATFFSSGNGFCLVSVTLTVIITRTHLDLIRYVEGIRVSLVSKVDAYQGVHQVVAVVSDVVESVMEVDMRISDACTSSQYNEACYDNEEEDDQLCDRDQVHESN